MHTGKILYKIGIFTQKLSCAEYQAPFTAELTMRGYQKNGTGVSANGRRGPGLINNIETSTVL